MVRAIKKILLISILSLQMFMMPMQIFAEAHNTDSIHQESHAEEEAFNPSKDILDQVMDSHEWHIFSTEHKHVSLHLPIILFDRQDSKLVAFSSKKFEHGHTQYKGYMWDVENDDIIKVDENNVAISGIKNPLDFSITKGVAGLFLSILVILLIFIPMGRKYKKNPYRKPSGLQSFLEPVVLYVKDEVIVPNIGEKKADRYIPYLLTLFFFILINNLMGLIPFFPFGVNVTGNIAVTLTLAVFTLLITNFSGNKNYWKHIFLPPGVPKALLIIMIPVELIGVITKPFALMIRLFANITAGHIVVLSLVSLIFIFQTMGMSPVSVIFVLFMDILELLVAFLQAYIFTLLTALYIGMAVEEAH